MRASVIIPTYGSRLEYLRDTLVTVQNQDFPLEDYEIIVVDNGPGHGVVKVVEEVNSAGNKNVICIKETSPGATSARHAGARIAKGEILSYIDDDVLLPMDWLRQALEPYRDLKVGCAGGKVVLQFEGTPPDWMEQFGNVCHSALDLGEKTLELKWPHCVWGANMTVPKRVFFEVGGFSPDIFGDSSLWRLTGDGECGFEKKIYDAGYKIVYEPKAWLHHRIPASRLTEEYFYHRSYFTGIMASYTVTRDSRGLSFLPLRLVLRGLSCFIHAAWKHLSSFVKPKWRVRSKANAMHWVAYGKHQWMAAFDKKLREYIFQESYL